MPREDPGPLWSSFPPQNMGHEVSHDYLLCQSFAIFSDSGHSHTPAENRLELYA